MSEDSGERFIRLADGRIINAETGEVAVSTEINKAFAPPPEKKKPGKRVAAFEEGTRRYLDDLPVPTFQSRPLAIIASYVLFGLNEADIAHILQTDVENIRAVIASDAFDKYMDAMLQNVREHDLDKVRKKINDAAFGAAEKIASLVKSPDEKVALAASKDVLDRASDGAYSSGAANKSGGFTIRIIDQKDEPGKDVKVEIDL